VTTLNPGAITLAKCIAASNYFDAHDYGSLPGFEGKKGSLPPLT
jgi:hypothetical protein